MGLGCFINVIINRHLFRRRKPTAQRLDLLGLLNEAGPPLLRGIEYIGTRALPIEEGISKPPGENMRGKS